MIKAMKHKFDKQTSSSKNIVFISSRDFKREQS